MNIPFNFCVFAAPCWQHSTSAVGGGTGLDLAGTHTITLWAMRKMRMTCCLLGFLCINMFCINICKLQSATKGKYIYFWWHFHHLSVGGKIEILCYLKNLLFLLLYSYMLIMVIKLHFHPSRAHHSPVHLSTLVYLLLVNTDSTGNSWNLMKMDLCVSGQINVRFFHREGH